MTTLDEVLECVSRWATRRAFNDDDRQTALAIGWQEWCKYGDRYVKSVYARRACDRTRAGKQLPGVRQLNRDPALAIANHFTYARQEHARRAPRDPADIAADRDLAEQVLARLAPVEAAALALLCQGEEQREVCRRVGRCKKWCQATRRKALAIVRRISE